jgi:hypothetical protein
MVTKRERKEAVIRMVLTMATSELTNKPVTSLIERCIATYERLQLLACGLTPGVNIGELDDALDMLGFVLDDIHHDEYQAGNLAPNYPVPVTLLNAALASSSERVTPLVKAMLIERYCR